MLTEYYFTSLNMDDNTTATNSTTASTRLSEMCIFFYERQQV
jgi:hypothetical protein